MRGVLGAAERAVSIARAYLQEQDPQSRVHDVQDDPRFMHRGVDLLWERADGSVCGVEVKGDRQSRQKTTYFFELVSNVEKDTPGWFLYSMADVVLYVFLQKQEVHELPLRSVREWFLPRAKEYPLYRTQTKTGPHLYTTVGAVVPVRDALKAVSSAKKTRLESKAR